MHAGVEVHRDACDAPPHLRADLHLKDGLNRARRADGFGHITARDGARQVARSRWGSRTPHEHHARDDRRDEGDEGDELAKVAAKEAPLSARAWGRGSWSREMPGGQLA